MRIPLIFLFSLFLLASCDTKLDTSITHYVLFDIEVGGRPEGQLKFGLYGKVVPKTANNFYKIATKGVVGPDGKNYSYTNSIFHRIIKEFMIQGGDITKR